MKTYLLATVSGAALLAASAASAADMPVKARPMVAAPWTWTGAYIGVNLGAALPRVGYHDIEAGSGQLAFLAGEFFAFSNWRVTFGGQAGYNWQMGNVVVGVEGDLNWIDGQQSTTIPALFGPPTVFVNSNFTWFATARGRLGWAVDRALLYATGGVAVARISSQWGFPGVVPFFSHDETRATWVAGAGFEYMLTRNVTAKVEGLYSDFGSTDYLPISGASLGGTYRSSFTNKLTVVRSGLNWKW